MNAEPSRAQNFARTVRCLWISSGERIACSLLFVILGSLFIGYAGLQTDEAMFAAPFYRAWRFFSIRIHHHNLPVMNMSYNGCLKTWLYSPLALLWHPSAVWVRLPMIVAGALTIVVFGYLVARLHSRRAAWVGCLLLAADTTFLLTHVYDWGPVALQQLLTVAAMLFAVRWFQGGSDRQLLFSAFCCGLAFWDKAVFAWVLSGLLAGLLLMARTIWPRITSRRITLAIGALCLGALPLIIYDLSAEPRFSTFRSNVKLGSDFTLQQLYMKFAVLRATVDGSALFGYIANEDDTAQPRAPQTELERASFALRSSTGAHRQNLMEPAILGALVLLPFLWKTRARLPMLFCVVAFVIAWLHMALAGGGTSAHHAILLWPLPALFVAVAFAEASRHIPFGGWLLSIVMIVLAVSGLLVTNQHLYQLARNGAGDPWTDAIYPLATGLKKTRPSQIILTDWGLADSLVVLNGNNPPILLSDDPLWSEQYSAAQKQGATALLADPNAVWIEHVDGHEIMHGINKRVREGARQLGFEPSIFHTYNDTNGRPIFQTLRFHPTRICDACPDSRKAHQ
jgi:4-amino-4-deoxy-L-arabinose transferase-like glycosyltransferase